MKITCLKITPLKRGVQHFPRYSKVEKVKTSLKKKIQLIFERFYIDQINECKISPGDNVNHNKLRVYATFKGSFKREPYIDLVQSRNQRFWLSRLRCSAHHLEIERGAGIKPPYRRNFATFVKQEKLVMNSILK